MYVYPNTCQVPMRSGEERMSDSLDLELGMVVNHHVCAGEAQEFLTAELS